MPIAMCKITLLKWSLRKVALVRSLLVLRNVSYFWYSFALLGIRLIGKVPHSGTLEVYDSKSQSWLRVHRDLMNIDTFPKYACQELEYPDVEEIWEGRREYTSDRIIFKCESGGYDSFWNCRRFLKTSNTTDLGITCSKGKRLNLTRPSTMCPLEFLFLCSLRRDRCKCRDGARGGAEGVTAPA